MLLCGMTVLLFFFFYKLLDYVLHQPRVDNYAGRYIFITGCDRGFGYNLALRLHGLGCHVFAGCFTEKGETELKKVNSERLCPVPLDVTNHNSIQKAFELVSNNLQSAGNCKWECLATHPCDSSVSLCYFKSACLVYSELAVVTLLCSKPGAVLCLLSTKCTLIFLILNLLLPQLTRHILHIFLYYSVYSIFIFFLFLLYCCFILNVYIICLYVPTLCMYWRLMVVCVMTSTCITSLTIHTTLKYTGWVKKCSPLQLSTIFSLGLSLFA